MIRHMIIGLALLSGCSAQQERRTPSALAVEAIVELCRRHGITAIIKSPQGDKFEIELPDQEWYSIPKVRLVLDSVPLLIQDASIPSSVVIIGCRFRGALRTGYSMLVTPTSVERVVWPSYESIPDVPMIVGALDRIAVAKKLETGFLDEGYDVECLTDGDFAQFLTIKYVLAGRVFAHHVRKSPLIATLREYGFRTLDITDGYDYRDHLYL